MAEEHVELTPEVMRDIADQRPRVNREGIRTCENIDVFLSCSFGIVSKEKLEVMIEKRKLFLDYLRKPEFWAMTQDEKAEAIGVAPTTIEKWMVQVPDQYFADALKEQRAKHARISLRVDAALIREATKEGGDAKHKELYFKRIEDWAPKTGVEVTRGVDPEMAGKSDKELILGLLAGLSAEERKNLLEAAGGGVVTEKQAGNVEGGEDVGDHEIGEV